MDLKFSFGGPSGDDSHDHAGHGAHEGPGTPLPFAGASGPSPISSSSTLELKVSRVGDDLVCEGLSGDGVSYASAQRTVTGEDPAALALALRSVLARGGAELPEPLIGSITAIVIDLCGLEVEVLEALGLLVSAESSQLAAVDSALQARTGISAGTPIRRCIRR